MLILIPGSIRIVITLPVCKILKLLAPLKRTHVWCQGRLRQKLFIRVGNPGAFSYLSPHSDGNVGMAGRGQVDNWASWIRKGDQQHSGREIRAYMTSSISLFLCILALAGSCVAQTGGQLTDAIQQVITRSEFRHAVFGIEFYSLDKNESIFSLNEQKLFVPGSTTKLLTEGTALELLGADYRFHTRVYRTGPISADGTLDGDLVLVASGDPNLSGRVRPDDTLAFEDIDHSYGQIEKAKAVPGDPLLIVHQLANQIGEHKIRKIKGRLLVDTTLFPEGATEGGTGVVISPIVINDNIIDVAVTAGPSEGTAASIQVSPNSPWCKSGYVKQKLM